MSKKPGILSILNSQSRPPQQQSQNLQVQQIALEKLLPNESNFYDTSDVEDLKASIELFGIKQPIYVKATTAGNYIVIAGHRRLLSARQLYEAGKEEFAYVPCIVEQNINSIKEKILLIHTNSTTRELSDWEKVEQLRQLKELLSEFKKTNEIPGRMRELLAETLHVSPSAVGRMETVDKNLVPEFKEELKNRHISMQTAVKLSKLEPEKQQEALREHKVRGATKAKDVVAVEIKPEPAAVMEQPTGFNINNCSAVAIEDIKAVLRSMKKVHESFFRQQHAKILGYLIKILEGEQQ